MRGQVDRQQSMFVAVDIEDRIPEDHPLRPIKQWCDRVQKRHQITPKVLGTDANYTSGGFLCKVQAREIIAHAAMPKQKIKGATAGHQARRRAKSRMKSQAYRQSQKMRKFIEPVIGWLKNIGGLSRTRFIGHERIQNDAMLAASAWNLLRMTRLAGAT